MFDFSSSSSAFFTESMLRSDEFEFKHVMFDFSSSSSAFFTESMLRSDEFEFKHVMFDFSSSSSVIFTESMLRSDEFEFKHVMFDFKVQVQSFLQSLCSDQTSLSSSTSCLILKFKFSHFYRVYAQIRRVRVQARHV